MILVYLLAAVMTIIFTGVVVGFIVFCATLPFQKHMKWFALLLSISTAYAQAPPGFDIFADGFEVGDYCDDPMVQPIGWSRVTVSWERQWSGPPPSPLDAQYPNSVGSPVPLGASKTGYKVIPFVPLPNQSANITWDVVQAYPGVNYDKPKPSAGMWLAISPCPGDLRSPSFEGDPYLRSGCRKFQRQGGLTFTDLISVSDHQACKVTPGVQHYLTVTPHWPEFGPEEHTCILDEYKFCDVGAVHSGGTQ